MSTLRFVRPRVGPRTAPRGVSLIEALVAMAVMAFGMLGVIGLQATLRANADLAKQRSEATRIAQETLEQWRAFSVLTTTAGHTQSYAGIASLASATVTGYTTNTTYTRVGTMSAAPVGQKTLTVDVTWVDRSGTTQNVRLYSAVTGIAPELSATLTTPPYGGATGRPPLGRNRAIPQQAHDFGDGTSGFMPPQSPGGTVAWLFNNVTGWITICDTTVANNAAITSRSDLTNCQTSPHLLMAGYLRFDTGFSAPTASSIVNPSGPTFPTVEVEVQQTAPSTGTVTCFHTGLIAFSWVHYYCAVPIDVLTPRWSGTLVMKSPPLAIASLMTDDSASLFKVCRYRSAASYTDVTTGLANENLAVIRAGAGLGVAFNCPSGVTWPHQPSS